MPDVRDGRSRDRLVHELQVHEMELRMQNEALRESQLELAITRDKYRDLFERAPIAYIVLESDSSVLEVNLAAAALLRIERDRRSGAKLASWVSETCSDRFARHMRAVLAGDAAQTCELTLTLRDGSLLDVRLESVRSQLAPQQWRTGVIDLTAVRQLERSLERSQRFEAIGTFASGLAHDFSNLLGVIAGGSDLALELIDPSEPARMAIERVKRATTHGKEMVRQLLRFASGPDVDSVGLFDLDVTIRGAEQLVRQVIGPKVELRMRLGAPGAIVGLDLGGPEEILLNLAANAAQAMPEGGELSIETCTVKANVALDPRLPPQSYALLSVTDTGSGMDARTQARVFEPFFTTKSAGNGTGLGLAMVYGIVKRAGGHIQLTSELRKGTTFRIYLPLSDERGAPAP
jgi:signal transduction histidine kinase